MIAAAIQPLNTFDCDNLLKSRDPALDCRVFAYDISCKARGLPSGCGSYSLNA